MLDWICQKPLASKSVTYLKKNIKNIPIIMLSARSEDVDSMQGLETGADDYVTEPYSVIVLVVRIKSQL